MAAATPEIFATLGVAPVVGRPFTLEDTALDHVVVVSYGFWKNRLAAEKSALGRHLDVDGVNWTIIGVLPQGAAFENVDILQPLTLSVSELSTWRSYFLSAIGRMRPGVTLESASMVLAAAASGPAGTSTQSRRTAGAVDFGGDMSRPIRDRLWFAQGVAGVILLIAGANLGNLLLLSGLSRRRELGVRIALGASRPRIVQQLLTESALLSAAGTIVGIGVAYVGVPVLVAAYPGSVPNAESITLSGRVLAVAACLASITILMFGAFPAAVASHAGVMGNMKGGLDAHSQFRGRVFRFILVGAEVCLGLALLTASGVLIRSYVRLTTQPIGFSADGVLTAQIALPVSEYDESRRLEFFEDLLNRLNSDRGVLSAAASAPLVFDQMSTERDFVLQPGSPRTSVSASFRIVTSRYLETMSTSLLQGRFLLPSDRTGLDRVAVVNDQFARMVGPDHVIGLQLRENARSSWITIVGVIQDTRDGFSHAPQPEVYLPLTQNSRATVRLVIRTRDEDPSRFVPTLQQILRECDPRLPMKDVQPLWSLIGTSVAERKFNGALLGLVAGLGLLLVSIGVYGVASHVTRKRSREMGIRMALGAPRLQVEWLVVRQGMMPIVCGICAGLAAAWYLTNLLRAQLFEVTPHDPWTTCFAVAVFLAIGGLASWTSARQAAKVDPVSILRVE
jgi:predicted permease